MKAERLERQKDDPFYLTDDRTSRKTAQPDVDSIPIVRLDDLPPLSQGTLEFPIIHQLHHRSLMNPTKKNTTAVDSHLPTLRSAAVGSSRQVFVIDKVGEMPEGAPLRSTAQLTRESSPSIRNGAATSSSTPAPSLSPFPPYEIEDEPSRTSSTPPPIKVTRAKKKTKTSGTGKKKRTATIEASASAGSNS